MDQTQVRVCTHLTWSYLTLHKAITRTLHKVHRNGSLSECGSITFTILEMVTASAGAAHLQMEEMMMHTPVLVSANPVVSQLDQVQNTYGNLAILPMTTWTPLVQKLELFTEIMDKLSEVRHTTQNNKWASDPRCVCCVRSIPM